MPIELVFDQGLGDSFQRARGRSDRRPGDRRQLRIRGAPFENQAACHHGPRRLRRGEGGDAPAADQAGEPENVRYLLGKITPAVSDLPEIRDAKAKMREAVIANVRKHVALAKENPVVKAAVAKKELAVVGAFYEISSGQVDFLESEEDLRVD